MHHSFVVEIFRYFIKLPEQNKKYINHRPGSRNFKKKFVADSAPEACFMNNFYPKQIVYILSVLALFILASCANIPLKTIPPPSPTAKLRVYVQPFTMDRQVGNPA